MIADGDVHLGDYAVHLSEYWYFHFHGLKQYQFIPDGDGTPGRRMDLKDRCDNFGYGSDR